MDKIVIKGARVHNLKNINVEIPRNKLTVVTGVSGSGKSTLAFDTLYAEGQRRYVESLSSYARQFLGIVEKPDVDSIEGLSPAISIEQKSVSKNPRSTIGTTTEIYDYLRILFARIGIKHCYKCKKQFKKQTAQSIINNVAKQIEKEKLENIAIVAPLEKQKKGTHKKLFEFLNSQGFSTVIVNGEKHFTDDEITLDKNKKHDISVRIEQFDYDNLELLPEAIETALKLCNGVVEVQYPLMSFDSAQKGFAQDERSNKNKDTSDTKNIITKTYTTHSACTDCNISIPELAPRDFSFNAPNGACQDCHGIGVKHNFDTSLVVPDMDLAIKDGAVKALNKVFDYYYFYQLNEACIEYGLNLVNKPLSKLTKKHLDILLHGSDEYPDFPAVMPYLQKKYLNGEEKRRKRLELYMRNVACPACKGKRLQPHILAVTIKNKNIIDLTDLSVEKLYDFLKNIKLTAQEKVIASRLVKEIETRVAFLYNVGLGYLSLSRTMATLSGGESQRIRLATQIGTNLTGVIYVLDEPSIGLHQRDNQKLIKTLKYLRDIGNTVVVVEHDTETIETADHIIDIGPRAGVHGGEVVATGTKSQIIKCKKSLTGQYISGAKKIHRAQIHPDFKKFISIKGARENNLQNLDVKIPQGALTCVTGVSGSGKSTLVNEILAKELSAQLNRNTELPGKHDSIEHNLDSIVVIDQSPIGRTPKSNPATYTKIFDLVRTLFSNTQEAKLRGYKPGRFSFNVPSGRCERCQGDGSIKMEMHFLPDVYVPCEECDQKRYNNETLEVTYKGKNIYDVLRMTVEEAREFFDSVTGLRTKLQTLIDVGLEYIELGQSALTFSGGEAQRIKLSRELAKRSKENTLYILDEPTTGLHYDDINKLLGVLSRLVKNGATCVVIEHNLDVIKNADYIIDLGPEGGEGGGNIVAMGTPQEVAKNKKSFTGKFLNEL